MHDSSLIAAALDGERSAFLTLAGRYAALSVAAAYSFARDIEVAEEVAAAGLAVAYTRLGVEGEKCNFPALVVRSVGHAHRGWRPKGRGRKRLRAVSWMKILDESKPSTARQERLASSTRRLREAVNRLPGKQRLAANLRFMAAMSYRDIARALRTKPEVVSSLLVRASAALRKRLIDLEPRERAS